MSKEIPLTKGLKAIVDDEDYEFLSKFKWHVCGRIYGNHYAARRSKKDNRPYVWMHRVIMNPPDDMQVDHIDGNGLNNTKENLRICTEKQNHANCKRRRTNKSGHKGIYFYKQRKKWVVQVAHKHVGIFSSYNDAIEAYKDAAEDVFGEFANIE